jgi:hypothetical protein
MWHDFGFQKAWGIAFFCSFFGIAAAGFQEKFGVKS